MDRRDVAVGAVLSACLAMPPCARAETVVRTETVVSEWLGVRRTGELLARDALGQYPELVEWTDVLRVRGFDPAGGARTLKRVTITDAQAGLDGAWNATVASDARAKAELECAAALVAPGVSVGAESDRVTWEGDVRAGVPAMLALPHAALAFPTVELRESLGAWTGGDVKVIVKGRYRLTRSFKGDVLLPEASFRSGASVTVVYEYEGAPACRVDLSGDGHADVTDIAVYLASWFAGEAAAEFDGRAGVDVMDIFAFLESWFAGCP